MIVNDSLFRFLNNFVHTSAFLDQKIVFLAIYLPWVLVAVLLVWLWYRHRDRLALERALFIAASALLSWLGSMAIKAFYEHPRPFAALADVKLLVPHAVDNSFPSSHAALFFAIGFALSVYNRRWGTIYLLGAVLISAARVAAGLHWPIDILGGFILAGLVVLFVRFGAKIKNYQTT